MRQASISIMPSSMPVRIMSPCARRSFARAASSWPKAVTRQSAAIGALDRRADAAAGAGPPLRLASRIRIRHGPSRRDLLTQHHLLHARHPPMMKTSGRA